jgi:hypothetical protein
MPQAGWHQLSWLPGIRNEETPLDDWSGHATGLEETDDNKIKCDVSESDIARLGGGLNVRLHRALLSDNKLSQLRLSVTWRSNVVIKLWQTGRID